MTDATPFRVTLLGAAVLLASCGGGQTAAENRDESLSEWEAKVRDVIDDTDRADHLVAASREFQDAVVALADESRRYGHAYMTLNADYDATREQFVALVADHAARHAEIRRRIYAVRSVMLENTTVAEFEELRDARNEVLEASTRAALAELIPPRPDEDDEGEEDDEASDDVSEEGDG